MGVLSDLHGRMRKTLERVEPAKGAYGKINQLTSIFR